MNIYSYKSYLPFLALFLLVPTFSFAQEQIPRAQPVDQATIQADNNSQAAGALGGTGSSGGSFSAGAAAQSMGTCLGASGLTGMVRTELSGLFNSIASTEVPTADNSLRGKMTGTRASAYISWDAMGYCMVNSIIESIAASTVQWINSGFQGNPVFVDDPAQFFTDIADIEAGRFINELSGGLACAPLRDIVRVNLATAYNRGASPYDQRNQCTFSAASGNLEQFMSGETFSWEDWFSYTQNPQNNPLGSTIYGSIELDRRIAQSIGVQSTLLDWGKGFLSFTDPETGKIKSPGTVIEGQVNQRLFSGESRINMADEFDEVVTALVNQLVKIAINEVTSQ